MTWDGARRTMLDVVRSSSWIALTLVVTLVAGPLLAERCATACEHDRASTQAGSDMACHREFEAGSRPVVDPPPDTCGHDLAGLAVVVSERARAAAAAAVAVLSTGTPQMCLVQAPIETPLTGRRPPRSSRSPAPSLRI
jgi:hypothetical protein